MRPTNQYLPQCRLTPIRNWQMRGKALFPTNPARLRSPNSGIAQKRILLSAAKTGEAPKTVSSDCEKTHYPQLFQAIPAMSTLAMNGTLQMPHRQSATDHRPKKGPSSTSCYKPPSRRYALPPQARTKRPKSSPHSLERKRPGTFLAKPNEQHIRFLDN